LNQVSATFNVLIIGSAATPASTSACAYAELAARPIRAPMRWAETGATMGSALFSSAVTTAIGFLVFWPPITGCRRTGPDRRRRAYCSRSPRAWTLLPALLALVRGRIRISPRPRFRSRGGCAMYR